LAKFVKAILLLFCFLFPIGAKLKQQVKKAINFPCTSITPPDFKKLTQKLDAEMHSRYGDA